MSLTAWLSLVIVCALGAMSPGPSLAVVVRNTIRSGRSAGVTTAIAHGLGVGVYALATALGLAAILAAEAALFTAFTLAGAAYLLWLGANALRGSDRFADHSPAGVAAYRKGMAAARDGFAIAFLNPKIALFFLALFSQFIPVDAGARDVAILAGTATVIDAGWYALIAAGLSAGGVARWLRDHGIWIERLTGAALVLLALTTAASVLA